MDNSENIPAAKLSPRVESDKSIRWYDGDTFKLTMQIILRPAQEDEGEQGGIIPLEDGDVILCTFRNWNNTVVHEFRYTEFENNTVTMDFDADITSKFPKGDYKYDITHIRDYRRTIAKSNHVVVE